VTPSRPSRPTIKVVIWPPLTGGLCTMLLFVFSVTTTTEPVGLKPTWAGETLLALSDRVDPASDESRQSLPTVKPVTYRWPLLGRRH